MLISSKAFRVTCGLFVAVMTLMLSGCGKLVSGANLKPTVRYKPSTTGAAATEADSTAAPTGDAVSSEGVGTLKGKVEFEGPFTTLPPLFVKGGDVRDKDVCAAVEAPDQKILIKDGGLANVFIYLKKAPKTSGGAIADSTLFFDQKNCVFKPHAMIIRVGQTVRVLNSDSVAHNTHTSPNKNTSFNSIVNPNDAKGAPLIYKQAEQEPIPVVCDIHSWMRAYHLPIDHPFAALSAEDGTFEIKDLPAGKHEFKIWHEAGGMLEKSRIVMIKPGDNDLTIKVTPSQLGR